MFEQGWYIIQSIISFWRPFDGWDRCFEYYRYNWLGLQEDRRCWPLLLNNWLQTDQHWINATKSLTRKGVSNPRLPQAFCGVTCSDFADLPGKSCVFGRVVAEYVQIWSWSSHFDKVSFHLLRQVFKTKRIHLQVLKLHNPLLLNRHCGSSDIDQW